MSAGDYPKHWIPDKVVIRCSRGSSGDYVTRRPWLGIVNILSTGLINVLGAGDYIGLI